MRYIGKRLITLVMTLLLVSLLLFLVFSIIPGDGITTMLGTEATPEQVEALRESMGLNQPIPIRFFNWLSGIVKGDFGISYKYQQPVADLLAGKMQVTLWLALEAFLFILIISVPLGILLSKYSKTFGGSITHMLVQMLMAIPPFFTGILIVLIFGLILKWFVPYSYVKPEEDFIGFLRCLTPAALAIAIPKIAMVVRFLRNSVLTQLNQDYVRTAYSKGCTKNRVYYLHILKNALIPVLTILGMILAEVMAGSIVVEQVFNLPGLGRFLVSSIGSRDFPVVSVIMLYIAAIVIVMNLIVDILYRVADPRIAEG